MANTAGHVLSPFKWYRHLMAFYPGGRDPAAPMFMGLDRKRPYLYRTALSELKRLIRLVQPDDNYGLHGARVGGYNKSLRANGDELTVAHGLWRSRGHTRYARWKDTEVAGLTAGMAGEQSVYQDAQVPADGRPLVPTPQPRRSGRGRGRGREGRGGRGNAATTTTTTTGSNELPTGWTTDIDGLFVPPAAMAAAGVEPQATLERARKIDKQMGLLKVTMAGAAAVRARRTRQGVN
jgi:hypothetical protein